MEVIARACRKCGEVFTTTIAAQKTCVKCRKQAIVDMEAWRNQLAAERGTTD